jgi:nitrite reductase/ring-hydroxylating ferredoxin subunit
VERLPPFPTSWYAVSTTADLKPGQLQPLQLFGERLVLFRTQSGQVGLLFATCPHLGADLSKGTVCGEAVRCPFHRFEFNTDGQCTGTAYAGPPPKQATTRTLPVRERNGLILAWWDAHGHEPSWEVPVHDSAGWSSMKTATFQFHGHPQEISENSVDMGHFSTIHGFTDVEMIERVKMEGAHLQATYGFVHHLGPVSFKVKFTAHVWGLGYSYVDTLILSTGIRTRLWVLPVPMADGQLTLRLGTAAHNYRLPLGLSEVVARVARRLLCRDAGQDIPIWESRAHVVRPALAKDDGPVGPYRHWTRQFYPRAADPHAEPLPAPTSATG